MVDSNLSSFLLGISLDYCGLVILRGKRSQWDWVPSCLEVALSWWIAPCVPLPRSGSSWISGSCLLVTDVLIVVHFDLCLAFDQKLSSPELFLVVLEVARACAPV